MAMEESNLYIWCLVETRDTALGHKTRFPARSTPFKELVPEMELAGLFENEYFHEALSPLRIEEVGEDFVTIRFRDERFTLRKGERHATSLYRSSNTYLSEYVGVEAELSLTRPPVPNSGTHVNIF